MNLKQAIEILDDREHQGFKSWCEDGHGLIVPVDLQYSADRAAHSLDEFETIAVAEKYVRTAGVDNVTQLGGSVGVIRDALKSALDDIAHWIRLAELQLEQAEQAGRWRTTPTQAGVDMSRKVKSKIADALITIRVAIDECGDGG